MQYIGGGGSGCTMAEAEAEAEAVAAADKLSGATLPPSGNTLPLRGLKMAVAAAGDPTGHRSMASYNHVQRFVKEKEVDESRFSALPGLPLQHSLWQLLVVLYCWGNAREQI